jgi:hypothetical protein
MADDLSQYGETEEEVAAVLSGMDDYFCIEDRSFVCRAKVAQGGERYGYPDMGLVAQPGSWLCVSPANGHRWVFGADSFRDFYCRVGDPVPPKKPKLQADGAKKGKSRSMSQSHGVSTGFDLEVDDDA